MIQKKCAVKGMQQWRMRIKLTSVESNETQCNCEKTLLEADSPYGTSTSAFSSMYAKYRQLKKPRQHCHKHLKKSRSDKTTDKISSNIQITYR